MLGAPWVKLRMLPVRKSDSGVPVACPLMVKNPIEYVLALMLDCQPEMLPPNDIWCRPLTIPRSSPNCSTVVRNLALGADRPPMLKPLPVTEMLAKEGM